jgi:hypothetical protein
VRNAAVRGSNVPPTIDRLRAAAADTLSNGTDNPVPEADAFGDVNAAFPAR